jgi:molybdenum cofactor guanylyltransferase
MLFQVVAFPNKGSVTSREAISWAHGHFMDPVTAFVLAGGKSSRMGQDKAFLPFEGRTLLARALETASEVAPNPWIVGSPAKFAVFGPVVEDVYPEQGPLGGIHAALSQTATDLNLMVAVDMPFLQPDFLSFLIAQARTTGAMAVVPRTTKGLQPLCSIYRHSFAEIAERALRDGKNKITLLFSEVQTRVIELEELKRNGFAEEMFRNLNTPEDLEEAGIEIPTNPRANLGRI